jgi:hypothetical protein
MASPTGPKKKKKHRSYLEILSASRVSKSIFRTENPEILGTKLQKLVTWKTWHPGLAYSQPYSTGKPFFGHYQEASGYIL